MDPIEAIQSVRKELDRLTSEALAGRTELSPEIQQRIASVQGDLTRAEESIQGVVGKAAPTAAEVRARAEQRAGEKLRRAAEIQELQKKHGARWVFAPTAEQLEASKVPPIAQAAVPGIVRSMFEQLHIRPAGPGSSGAGAIDDREIWEDLSESEQLEKRPGEAPRAPREEARKEETPKPERKPPAKQPPVEKSPKNPSGKHKSEEIWEDLSEMD